MGHWNANGVRGNYRELLQFLWDYKIDIMLLNETRLTPINKFLVPGFHVIRKDRLGDRAHGRVSILVRNCINYTEIRLDTKYLENVAIKLCENTLIVSVYNSPNIKLVIRELELIFNSGDKVILYGDLNAKNSAWNFTTGNANGKILLAYALKKFLKIIH